MGAIKGWKRRTKYEGGSKTRWWDNLSSTEAFVLVHKQLSGKPAKWGITVFTRAGQQEMSIYDLRGRANTEREAIAKAMKWMRGHPRG